FCGGTHVRRAGDIGLFKIVSEGGIAQGVRRIEAVTGVGALGYLRRLESDLARAATALRRAASEVPAAVDKLLGELKAKDREIVELQKKLASGGGASSSVQTVNGVKVLAHKTDVADPKALREAGDRLRETIGSGVVVLAGVA